MTATIYNDGQGNFFMGTSVYANHSLAFESVNYFKGTPHSEISDSINALCATAGLNFRNVLPQSDFDQMLLTTNYWKMFLYFGASDDINDRYGLGGTVGNGAQGGISALTGCPVVLYNDSGCAALDNNYDPTNHLIECGNESEDPRQANQSTRIVPMGCVSAAEDRAEISWTGHATNKSLALFAYQRWFNFPSNIFRYAFWYAGEPVFTNTNQGGYYSGLRINRAIALATSTEVARNETVDTIDTANDKYTVNAKHYIATQEKDCLIGGRADWTLACQAGTGTPPAPPRKWSTNSYLFDDDTPKGDPAICRIGNIIAGEDDGVDRYVIGRPEKLAAGTTSFPDGYSNPNVGWMPVGQYSNRTLMMMCWSP